jgi:IS30 family transposase
MAGTTELQHLRRGFWRGVRAGLPTVAAARQAGVSADRGFRWFREAGGVPPLSLGEPAGRYLSLSEREEISRGLAGGDNQTAIAARLGRDKSVISREIARNSRPDGGPVRCWRTRSSTPACNKISRTSGRRRRSPPG